MGVSTKTHRMTVAAGQKWRIPGRGKYTFRVMGVVDGWVMARYPGCAPFIEHWRFFELHYERVSPVADNYALAS